MNNFSDMHARVSPEVTTPNGIIHKLAVAAVLSFIFIIPWGDGVWDGLPRMFGILSFGLSILLVITKGTHKNFTFYHLFVILFGAWVILSVIWSPDTASGVELAKRVFQIILLPILFTLVLIKKNDILRAYQSYVFGNIVASSIIIYNYLNGIESPYYNRYTIANIETDTMSIILAIAIPLAAYLATQYQNKWLKMLNLLVIPIIIFAIFLTGTRTGSIAALIGVAYWLFTQRHAPVKIKITMLSVFILSIVAIFSFAPQASVDRIFSTGKSIKTGTLNSRTLLWDASIAQWKNSPVVGIGLGGIRQELSKKHLNYDGAHNTYIHLLTESGIIGLTLYLLIILSILYYILLTPLSEKAFLLSLLLVILVSQLTLHTHIQKETWFVLTMLAIHAYLYSTNYKISSLGQTVS